MNFARIFARGRLGVDAPLVSVEVFISRGLPSLSIVGMPETAVRESKDRVRSAIIHSGFDFPKYRLVINLGPADLPKEGGRYDLAIAIGILAASEQIPSDNLEAYEFIGELALSGEVRSIPSVLPSSLACHNEGRTLILPTANLQEAALCSLSKNFGAEQLKDVCNFFHGEDSLISPAPSELQQHAYSQDLKEVQGQVFARRALEIAAAGRHHMLMIGSPGSGKTMLAERLMTIQPQLTDQECFEIATLYSCRGLWHHQLWGKRPFRAPHHTASPVALVGGGSKPLPGEISLSQHGVLFLDELPEFDRKVLEVLREPLESRHITISRAAYQITYPAHFQLIAAMNPCPCGYKDDPVKQCRCSPEAVARYQAKLSGPLLDRIDLQVRVPPIDHRLLLEPQSSSESSEVIRQRVAKADSIQQQRQGCSNAQLKGNALHQHGQMNQSDKEFLIQAADKLLLSARSLHRVIRVARTIADLSTEESIAREHLTEALAFRLDNH